MIKNGLVALLLVFGIANNVYAEGKPIHQKTQTPKGARYDIIQSHLVARLTFRLDRYYGKVAQIVKTVKGGNAWQNMEIVDLPKISDATEPRFLIFTSGLAGRHTFLIDTVTGNSWTVVTAEFLTEGGEKIDYNYWKPFEYELNPIQSGHKLRTESK